MGIRTGALQNWRGSFVLLRGFGDKTEAMEVIGK